MNESNLVSKKKRRKVNIQMGYEQEVQISTQVDSILQSKNQLKSEEVLFIPTEVNACWCVEDLKEKTHWNEFEPLWGYLFLKEILS